MLIAVCIHAAWRAADLDELAVTALPELPAWLALTVLVTAVPPGDRAGAVSPSSDVPPALVGSAILVAAAHAVAWSTEVDGLRLAATLALAAVLSGFVAVWPPVRTGPRSVADLGTMVALAVIVGQRALEAIGTVTDPADAPQILDARGPTLGALAVVAGMTLAESGFRPAPRPIADDGAGAFQFLILAVGWLLLLTGTALDALDLLVTAVALHVLAVVVFIVRHAPTMLIAVTDRRMARWFAVTTLAAAAYVGLLAQIAVGFADGRYADATAFPRWLELAVDLTAFVGLAAGGLVGLVAAERGGGPSAAGFVDLVAFVVFVAGMGAVVTTSAIRSPVGAQIAWLALAAAVALAVAASTRSRPRPAVPAPDRPH